MRKELDEKGNGKTLSVATSIAEMVRTVDIYTYHVRAKYDELIIFVACWECTTTAKGKQYSRAVYTHIHHNRFSFRFTSENCNNCCRKRPKKIQQVALLSPPLSLSLHLDRLSEFNAKHSTKEVNEAMNDFR